MSDSHITTDWVDQELERCMTIEGVSHYPAVLRALKEALERERRLIKAARAASEAWESEDLSEAHDWEIFRCMELLKKALLGETTTVQE